MLEEGPGRLGALITVPSASETSYRRIAATIGAKRVDGRPRPAS